MVPPEGIPPALLKPEEMKLLLDALSANSLAERQAAAKKIYAHAFELTHYATQEWFSDPELAGCFAMSDASFPETTVGIAVEPLKFAQILQANGSPRLADVPPDIDAKEFELDFSGGFHIDVLTTRDRSGEGTIARFLNRNGEGLQQVELAVRNVERATALLESRIGLKPVYPKARGGADRTLVNFFLVDLLIPAGERKKVLIELVQAADTRA